MDEGRPPFRWLRWLTILGPTLFVMIAELFRYFYLRHVLAPWQVSGVAVLVTVIAAGGFSSYVFGVVRSMEQERNRYRESMLALQERERLGREMHDGLAPDLAALKFTIHRIRDRLYSGETSSIGLDLDQTQAMIERCSDDVRQNLYDLRAGHELIRGLWRTLSLQIDDFRSQTGISIEGRRRPEVQEPMDPRVSVQLLRIVQEALVNVRKHSGAKRVLVEAVQRGAELCLYVRDDGKGFIRSKDAEGRHFGLLVMQERAHSVGANVVIAKNPEGWSTVVEISWINREGGEVHRKSKASVSG